MVLPFCMCWAAKALFWLHVPWYKSCKGPAEVVQGRKGPTWDDKNSSAYTDCNANDYPKSLTLTDYNKSLTIFDKLHKTI